MSKADVTGEFASDPKERTIFRLAAFLHLRLELYDREVCTGTRYGTVVATTPYERELSVKNAKRIHKVVKMYCEIHLIDLMAVRRRHPFRRLEDAYACLIPENNTRLPDRLVFELQQTEEWVNATEASLEY